MDIDYMKRALILAQQGQGWVDPNPLVGAVIVKNDRIIGEGYHQKYGHEHAEVNAFLSTQEDVSGGTMYVTLEPCSHYGKTPPCASLIIEKKIARVVIASIDPNPLVAGKGIKMLQQAGIQVEIGVLDQQNRVLNKVYFKYIETTKPYVILKTAMTLDGKIATHTNQSKWITNEKSREIVHQMRRNLMGIMVGVNTIIYDDPQLTCRLPEHHHSRQPIRIVLDTNLEMPINSYVVRTARKYKTMLFTTEKHTDSQIEPLLREGVEVHRVSSSSNELNLQQVMHTLAINGINSVLLEGGSTLNFSVLKEKLVDEVHTFIGSKIIGGKQAITPVGGLGIANIDEAIQLALVKIENIAGDVQLIYEVVKED